MKTKTKAFLLLINEFQHINTKCYQLSSNLFNKLSNNLLMFRRFFYIFYIFISETIKFHYNNWICILIFNIPLSPRLELVKSITNRLENLNIVYVKVFQSLCLEKNILYENEKDYLLKYTDNVPYKTEELDYELLNLLESKYNIRLEDSQPINSGIVGLVFKGLDGNDNDSKVVIKLLKKNIENRLNSVFDELEYLTFIMSYIPYLNSINLHKFFLDNKELLIDQIDFIKEVVNIEIFKFKNQNLPEYRIPYVYKEITNDYKNVIVMENIKGLTIGDIETFDSDIKEEFGKLLIRFGFTSIFYNSAIHCDLHAGNIFFYINDDTSFMPKYQLGLIDFGICSFPDKNNQNYYYIFFNDFFYKKDFSDREKLDNIIHCCIHEKEYYNNFSQEKKENLFSKIIESIKFYSIEKEVDIEFLININMIFKKFNLKFSKEFNNIFLSLASSNNLARLLCNSITKTQFECLEKISQVNKLLEF